MARKYIKTLVGRPEVTLVFVSGRHRALVEEAITKYELPTPDFVIADVGTTIYRVGASHAWSGLVSWERRIATDWGGKSRADLEKILSDFDMLQAQEEDKQNTFKLSYYLPIGLDTDYLASRLGQRLKSAGVRARLVWSDDDIEQRGLLDVIPQQASKLHAIEALMELQGFDLANTVFCGDSGNDMDVLVSRVPSVLVANSRQDIQAFAVEKANQNGTEAQLYIASGNFLDMNGNYAAGMLEGITHYYPATLAWLGESTGASESVTS
jgi:HAD superfamily hydrolase (TIGR01484 family)